MLLTLLGLLLGCLFPRPSQARPAVRQLAREVSSVLWLPCVCNCRSCCLAAPCASARPSSSYNKNLTMLSSSSLCPLLPTLSAPWRRQTAARAKQTRLIGTQTPLIKCWLCLGCFVIIRAVFINRGSHSNFLADSCHSLRRLRECQRASGELLVRCVMSARCRECVCKINISAQPARGA